MDRAPRLLAVDDERLMRMALRHHLAHEGYDVDTAGSVREAMDRLDGGPYDLVLTDMALPDGRGLEVVRYAKTLYPRAGVVVLTASVDEAVTDEALAAGADAILLKPCSLHQLAAEADRVLHPPAPPRNGPP